MNSQRIKAILADPDFVAFLDQHLSRLQSKVMAKATTPEDRTEALAQFHALKELLGSMRAEAQNAEDNSG